MRLVETFRGWPTWARIAAPAAVAVLAVGAVAGGDEGGEAPSRPTSTTTTEVATASIEDAVSLARADLSFDVLDTRLENLIRALCAAGTTGRSLPAAESAVAVAGPIGDDHVAELVAAAGKGAEAFCPEEVAAEPGLLPDVVLQAQSLANLLVATTETTSTLPPVATTALLSQPATTRPLATAPPVTQPPATQPPVTSPPPTQPPPTQPPATQPPAPPSSGTVHPGAFCSPAGATGVASAGEPMTCSTAKCDGTPYDQPRWRRTSC